MLLALLSVSHFSEKFFCLIKQRPFVMMNTEIFQRPIAEQIFDRQIGTN
jgi:hypothetical protein